MRENLVESFLILSKKSILSWTQGGERKFQWFAKQYTHLSFYLVRRNPFTKILFRIALGIKEWQDWIHIKILYFSNSLHKWWKVTLTWTRISLKLSKFFGTDKFFSVPSNKAVQDIAALNYLSWKRTNGKKCPIRPGRFEKSLDVWQTKCQCMRNICCWNSKTWYINVVCYAFQLTVWKVVVWKAYGQRWAVLLIEGVQPWLRFPPCRWNWHRGPRGRPGLESRCDQLQFHPPLRMNWLCLENK